MADDNTPPLPNQTFLASKEPAQNGYGQNGYQGPSSLNPGQSLPANQKFAAKPKLPGPPNDSLGSAVLGEAEAHVAKTGDHTVYPTVDYNLASPKERVETPSYGMRNRRAESGAVKVPDNNRPVFTRPGRG